MGAVTLQQRAQRVGELDRERDVVAGVRPEPRGGRAVVSAAHPRVQGHHQPVVTRHPGHLQQHVPPERHSLLGARVGGQRRPVDPRRLARFQGVGADVDVAVVGRDRPVLDEVPPARLQRPHVARVVASVDVRGLAQLRHRVRPPGLARLEVAVRAEGRDDPPRPGRVGRERGVRGQVVARVVGGGQHRDLEPLIERPRPIGVGRQPLGQLVVDRVGRRRRRAHPDVEDVAQLRLQPVAHRCAAVGIPVRTQQPPHLPGLLLGQRTTAHAELVEPNSVGMQQPGHVVVRGHEQRGRVGERRVVEQQSRVDVTMRRDDRQLAHRVVEPAGDRAHSGLRWQQTVRVQLQPVNGGSHPPHDGVVIPAGQQPRARTFP